MHIEQQNAIQIYKLSFIGADEKHFFAHKYYRTV